LCSGGSGAGAGTGVGTGAVLSTLTRFLHVAVHRDGPALNALPHLTLREGQCLKLPQQPQQQQQQGAPFAGASGAANAEVPVVTVNTTSLPCIVGISRNGAMLCTTSGADAGIEVR
jgi:hypothetical protein